MSYQIPDNASLDRLIAYTATSIAALQAMDETRALAEPWSKLLADLQKERAEREAAELEQLAASARVKVWDARWDDAITDISSRAYLAAHKDDTAEPYVSLFGTIKAKQATHMGPHKATTLGNTLLAKLREQKHPELTPLIEPFASLNQQLTSVAAARSEAHERVSVYEVRRYKLIERMEALIAQSEIGVLTALPGQRTTLRAALSWNGHMRQRSRSKVKPDSTDLTPSSADDDGGDL